MKRSSFTVFDMLSPEACVGRLCSLSRSRSFDGTRTALGTPLSRTDFLRKGFLRDCRGRAYQPLQRDEPAQTRF